MANLLLPIKDAKKAIMLETMALKGSVRAGVMASGISYPTHYNWMKDDPEYAAAAKMAQELYADRLEEEADRRAVEGIDVNHYGKDGQVVATEKKFSDLLLIFKLKGARPEKYRDNPVINIDNRSVHIDTTEALAALRAARTELLTTGDSNNAAE